jgi:hypothetical protein
MARKCAMEIRTLRKFGEVSVDRQLARRNMKSTRQFQYILIVYF